MRLISSPTYGIKQGRHQCQITERRHQSSQLEKVYRIKNDQTDIFKKQKMNKARKLLRSAQRRARTSVRNTLAEKIMQSSQNDNKLFHKLVQRQRKNNQNATTDIVISNGIEESIPAHILDYFEVLYSCDESKIQQTLKLKN